jgi:DNA-binding beta-propeller fold protein YncE
MTRRIFITLVLLVAMGRAAGGVSVTRIDLLRETGFEVNGAGPLLVAMDGQRGRLVVANTLSSSISLIECGSGAVVNIALKGRALQHLKSEALAIGEGTGSIYLVGTNCLHIVSPDDGKAETIPTGIQFESVAVDEKTGNVFLAGRESPSLGLWKRGSKRVEMLTWLDHAEPLINLNMTPPPPIRKVVPDNRLGRIIAVDGFTSTLYILDGGSGEILSSRPIPLSAGGRWHLAGYDERDHTLYLVTETGGRKVIEAARIDVTGTDDVVVGLPGFTEGVGIVYNPSRREIYIPYDNHASVHVVSFDGSGSLDEIPIPAYGNDASAVDRENGTLYVASWAFGEIDVIDLESRTLARRIMDLGIIPHMFTMAFDQARGRLYFPKGASAVNGTFGAAVTELDPATGTTRKIYTGFAPVDMIELPGRGSILAFGSENRFAEVRADGRFEMHELPFDYPIEAIRGPGNGIYLSYGPHQSYWPTVYIWGAKNGILTIDSEDLSFYDRRIPRQAHELVLDRDGICYFTQNNWGKEEQFLGRLQDGVRVFEPGRRLPLVDEVEREITQRILRYDESLHRLYLARIGERDEDPSVLQIIDPGADSVLARIELGLTATDLFVGDDKLYVANFHSGKVSVVDKRDYSVREIETDQGPLRLCGLDDRLYVLNHEAGNLQELGGGTYPVPGEGKPDNIFVWQDGVVVVSHGSDALLIHRFDPEKKSFELLHRESYPFGDTGLDTGNVSFYVRGQFGDALFQLSRGLVDSDGKLWISDFLSGRIIVLSDE